MPPKIHNVSISPPVPATGPGGGRLGDLHRAVITVTFKVELGLHMGPCTRCDAAAPPPTSEQLKEWDVDILNLHNSYLHTDAVEDTQNYLPDTWGAIDGKLLCAACLIEVNAALAAVMKGKRHGR